MTKNISTKKIHDEFANELFSFFKKNLNLIRSTKLTTLKEGYPHGNIVSYATYSPWLKDEVFMRTYESIKQNTLVDIYRCFELWQLIKQTSHVRGDILEVGVWKGGTGALMATAAAEFCSKVNIHLVDTFSGVVKAIPDHDTNYTGGEHQDTELEIVQALADQLNLTNVKIYQGIYPEDVSIDLDSDGALKLCHIDVDTYQSAKDIFYHVWPSISVGGIVVFDDYGFWGCEGVTKLVDELDIPNACFVYNVNGHGLLIKTSA